MFVIYGNLNLIPGHYDDWYTAFSSLSPHVWQNEPQTLTYYFGVPEEYKSNLSATPHFLAFECYTSKSDLYETHFHSPAMGKFLETIPQYSTTGLDLVHFEDTAGFLDKPGDAREAGIIYDTRIQCKPGSRSSILSALSTLAASVERDEPDTWTFLVLKSLDNEDTVRIFERYKTREALERHMVSEGVLGFFRGCKEGIKSVEQRGYVPNGYGWLHR